MVYYYLIASLLLLGSGEYQGLTQVNIFSPQPGEAIQGVVEVTGNAVINDFQTYELSFAFKEDPTNTWFTIQIGTDQVREGTLGEWNTNGLTDGTYSIRLKVNDRQGQSVEEIVGDLRLRNYTAIETSTPGPQLPEETSQVPTSTPAPAVPTPTALPPNPAILKPETITQSIHRGAVFAILFMAGLGLYSWAGRRSQS